LGNRQEISPLGWYWLPHASRLTSSASAVPDNVKQVFILRTKAQHRQQKQKKLTLLAASVFSAEGESGSVTVISSSALSCNVVRRNVNILVNSSVFMKHTFDIGRSLSTTVGSFTLLSLLSSNEGSFALLSSLSRTGGSFTSSPLPSGAGISAAYNAASLVT
jgi:hypothetical protein